MKKPTGEGVLVRNTATGLRAGLVLASATAMLALSACGGSGGDTPPETAPAPANAGGASDPLDPAGELATAAKAEGEVVWYSANMSGLDDVIQEFTDKYGVNVISVKMSNTELQTKFLSEAEIGAPQSDAVMTSYTGFFPDSVDAGYMLSLPETLTDFPGDYPAEFVVEGQTPLIAISAVGLAYNKDTVDNPPTDWADLVESEYEGRIVSVDPRGSNGFQQFFDALLTEYGAEMLEGIGENTVRVYDSTSPQLQALSAGEGDIALYASRGQTAVISEANPSIEFFQPDFTTGVPFALGLTAESANPNAAQLLAEWLTSEEGQESLTEHSKNSVPLFPASLPSDYVPAQLAAIPQERLNEIFAALGLS